jgi:undecaprenyl-phosphate 4-deoxy-4-formamido-L-arabinose transferase
MSQRPVPLPVELSIVVPVYQARECLVPLADAIDAALGPSGLAHEVILVNDGSTDGSWGEIQDLCGSRPGYVGIDLRRNFGQDNAIMTGLRAARGEAVAIMDDDLQHDPRDLPALLEPLARDGADVVYADFRAKHQAAWKNLGSWFNGKCAEWVLDKPKGLYLSPYKVIRKEVVDLICRHDGPEPYVDGLLLQVTSRIAQVSVGHHARHAGRSSYTFGRSLRVWARLATSFSVRPLRLVIWAGLVLAAAGTALAAVVIAYRLLRPGSFERAVAGWASLMVAALLTAAVGLVFLGVIGEYAGRTYLSVCRKPQAAVREVLRGDSDGVPEGSPGKTVHSREV